MITIVFMNESAHQEARCFYDGARGALMGRNLRNTQERKGRGKNKIKRELQTSYVLVQSYTM